MWCKWDWLKIRTREKILCNWWNWWREKKIIKIYIFLFDFCECFLHLSVSISPSYQHCIVFDGNWTFLLYRAFPTISLNPLSRSLLITYRTQYSFNLSCCHLNRENLSNIQLDQDDGTFSQCNNLFLHLGCFVSSPLSLSVYHSKILQTKIT